MNFSEFLKKSPKNSGLIAEKLREMILPLDESIEEDLRVTKTMSSAFYSIGAPSNVIAMVNPGKEHCKIYFHHFEKVDIRGLKLEGKGKHSRHLKIKEWKEVDAETVRAILKDITRIVSDKAKT
ncbi:MAG: DUF1801 domain-containing protein [Bacteroidetes bacterium]|nr:DUF1801 domain-containing protein [Bacteroidota bacterium]